MAVRQKREYNLISSQWNFGGRKYYNKSGPIGFPRIKFARLAGRRSCLVTDDGDWSFWTLKLAFICRQERRLQSPLSQFVINPSFNRTICDLGPHCIATNTIRCKRIKIQLISLSLPSASFLSLISNPPKSRSVIVFFFLEATSFKQLSFYVQRTG